jgi:hypothetical protein
MAGNPAGPCDPFWEEGSCRECVTSHCSTQCGACGRNAECVAFVDCMRSCGGDFRQCEDSCIASHAAGQDAWINLGLCIYGAMCGAGCVAY